ncbi:hypothetical protein [Brachyspira innocens]|uniref:hypothetical protein n=1 Tax=Brachyspira innocens TaxID=13264 RepID=UPI00036C40DA|nr:hypothetical protein [Brachyspira innocens]
MSYFIDLLRRIWNFIKRIFVKIINFASNIVNFFKSRNRLRKLEEDRDIIAVSIKENLGNNNYRVVNCLYDEAQEEIVDMEEDAIGIESNGLDEKTKQSFGNKDMIVLK